MPDFEQLIKNGREQRGLEYKAGLGWDELKAKIAKTALGMANLLDGGYIVIGVAERSRGVFELEGVSDAVAASYSEDDVQAFVNEYAEPHIAMEVHKPQIGSQQFVVILVHEFSVVPVICAKDAPDFRRGAVYIRSTRMRETSEVRTAEEMRAIIELATEKRLAELVGQLQRVGILDALQSAAAAARFAAQAGEV